MEMRNTPPRLTIGQRETDELVEDLCIALRKVGCGDYSLRYDENDERAINSIKEVQQIYSELFKRNSNIQPRIEQLSLETSWLMEDLLQECLAYPKKIPYVRDSDGIRRALRCNLCGKNEFPDSKGLWFCNQCVHDVIDAIEQRKPLNGVILIRTYNQEYRCKHADDETVLMIFDDEYDRWSSEGICKVCLLEELERRKNLND